MQIAPTYLANLVTLIAIVLAYFKIQIAPEALQTTLTTILVIGTPLFTLFRQLWTGRSTLAGTRPSN
jgi:hypothetical protein